MRRDWLMEVSNPRCCLSMNSASFSIRFNPSLNPRFLSQAGSKDTGGVGKASKSGRSLEIEAARAVQHAITFIDRTTRPKNQQTFRSVAS